MHYHSTSESLGDQLPSVQNRIYWSNVAKLCFLLGIDPARANVWITRLSIQVQWAPGGKWWGPWSYGPIAQTTLILLAVVPSMFSWSTTGCRFFTKCTKKDVSLHKVNSAELQPRWMDFSTYLLASLLFVNFCFPSPSKWHWGSLQTTQHEGSRYVVLFPSLCLSVWLKCLNIFQRFGQIVKLIGISLFHSYIIIFFLFNTISVVNS